MKFRLLVPTVLACLAGGLAAAQEAAPAKPQEKPIPAAATIAKGKLKTDLTLIVTGLTADNAAQVKTALEGMKRDSFDCSGCKAKFAKSGDCPACKMPLAASKETVLGLVTTHPDKHQIVLQTKEGMELRLSSLERTLLASTIKIDDKKLMLPGSFTLLVSGALTADLAQKIETALADAKLLQSGHAEVTPMGVRIHAIAKATATDLAHIREVVTKAGPAFKITDVIWNDWNLPAAG